MSEFVETNDIEALADKYFEDSKYLDAIPLYTELVEKGNPFHLYRLGLCYSFTENYKKAFSCFKKAADQDYLPAIVSVANCYFDGEGVNTDEKQAVQLYRIAVVRGSLEAMYQLAFAYDNGCGVEENPEKAFHWIQKAAEGGYSEAYYNLATYYHHGFGTPVDLEKAKYWYEKDIAENGESNGASDAINDINEELNFDYNK